MKSRLYSFLLLGFLFVNSLNAAKGGPHIEMMPSILQEEAYRCMQEQEYVTVTYAGDGGTFFSRLHGQHRVSPSVTTFHQKTEHSLEWKHGVSLLKQSAESPEWKKFGVKISVKQPEQCFRIYYSKKGFYGFLYMDWNKYLFFIYDENYKNYGLVPRACDPISNPQDVLDIIRMGKFTELD